MTYRTIAHQRSTDGRHLARTLDGRRRVVLGAAARRNHHPVRLDQFSGNGSDTCGDGPFACPSGLTFARFSSLSAVAADATGVHVVYSAETAAGQAKIFARNSPDGLTWPSRP